MNQYTMTNLKKIIFFLCLTALSFSYAKVEDIKITEKRLPQSLEYTVVVTISGEGGTSFDIFGACGFPDPNNPGETIFQNFNITPSPQEPFTNPVTLDPGLLENVCLEFSFEVPTTVAGEYTPGISVLNATGGLIIVSGGVSLFGRLNQFPIGADLAQGYYFVNPFPFHQ